MHICLIWELQQKKKECNGKEKKQEIQSSKSVVNVKQENLKNSLGQRSLFHIMILHVF